MRVLLVFALMMVQLLGHALAWGPERGLVVYPPIPTRLLLQALEAMNNRDIDALNATLTEDASCMLWGWSDSPTSTLSRGDFLGSVRYMLRFVDQIVYDPNLVINNPTGAATAAVLMGYGTYNDGGQYPPPYFNNASTMIIATIDNTPPGTSASRLTRLWIMTDNTTQWNHSKQYSTVDDEFTKYAVQDKVSYMDCYAESLVFYAAAESGSQGPFLPPWGWKNMSANIQDFIDYQSPATYWITRFATSGPWLVVEVTFLSRFWVGTNATITREIHVGRVDSNGRFDEYYAFVYVTCDPARMAVAPTCSYDNSPAPPLTMELPEPNFAARRLRRILDSVWKKNSVHLKSVTSSNQPTVDVFLPEQSCLRSSDPRVISAYFESIVYNQSIASLLAQYSLVYGTTAAAARLLDTGIMPGNANQSYLSLNTFAVLNLADERDPESMSRFWFIRDNAQNQDNSTDMLRTVRGFLSAYCSLQEETMAPFLAPGSTYEEYQPNRPVCNSENQENCPQYKYLVQNGFKCDFTIQSSSIACDTVAISVNFAVPVLSPNNTQYTMTQEVQVFRLIPNARATTLANRFLISAITVYLEPFCDTARTGDACMWPEFPPKAANAQRDEL